MESEIERKLEEIRRRFSELEREMKDMVSGGEGRPRVRTLEIGGAVFTDLPPLGGEERNENLGITIRRVPKEILGYNVLGRAFPDLGLIEIADHLEGNELEEVKLHEILHVWNPDLNEYNIRVKTRLLFPRRTRFE